jgi:hypothetical protein
MRQFVNDIQAGSLSAEAEIQRSHELTYQSNKNMIEVGIKWAIGILALDQAWVERFSRG